MKALILLRDIYSIISLADNESFDLTEDIYSIIVGIDTCGLNEGYLQYHRMY